MALMTLGETLFLNAKLPTGKEFMPREISLLIGEEKKSPAKWKTIAISLPDNFIRSRSLPVFILVKPLLLECIYTPQTPLIL